MSSLSVISLSISPSVVGYRVTYRLPSPNRVRQNGLLDLGNPVP